MHLEEGIGRGGYRMLALVFLGIGALGLLSSLYAFIHPTLAFFNALGFVLMGVALGALFVLVLVILGRPAPAPVPEPSPAGAPPLGIRPVAFDFAEDEGEAEEEPEPPEPAPPERATLRSPGGPRMPAPSYDRAARVVGLPDSPFERLPPPEQWAPPEPPRAPVVAPPVKRSRSGMTLGEKRELERMGKLPAKPMLTVQGTPATEDEMELAIPLALHPARTPPPKPGVPTVLAKPAAPDKQDADWMPEGMTRGICSKCRTVLLAPQQRPINLRCPRCDKITLLK